MIRGKTLLLVLMGAMALGVGIWLGQALTRPAAETPPSISGILFSEPKEVASFTLTDQSGQPFTQEDLKGAWTFLFFGYTYCPDVCPMTLTQLNAVQQHLAQQGLDRDARFVLISVDPQRDTPERLGQYVAYFNPTFRGVTGASAELDKPAKQLGVIYMPASGQEGDDYAVDHSASVILINPQARLHAVFTPPHDPGTLAADFVKIRERYQATH